MHILSVVRGEFFSLHRTLKCKYSKKWSRQKLENGEAQVQACSKRDYSSVISQKLNEIQQFAQKYNRHVGWRQKDVSTKVGTTNAATKGKGNWTPAEQAAWVRRPIGSLEVQLAGASENLELDQKLKEELKCLKTQKLQNLMTLNYTRGKLIDYMRKGWAKTDLSRKYQILRVNSNWRVVWTKETTGALKLESDKPLEELKKQEKVTDVVIACCSQLWNSMHSQCENLGVLKIWKKWIEHYGKRRLTSSGWKEKGHTSALLKLYNSCIFHLWDYILIMPPQYGISNFKKTWINLRRSKGLHYECTKVLIGWKWRPTF